MIKINGKVYSGDCSSISISNNVMSVNGKEIDLEKALTVTIEGNIDSFNADACKTITVTGSVHSLKTMSGDVRCGDVAGNVKTMSGDVDAKIIHGDASTMSGDIST